jgi:uncharacterized protein YlaI
MEKEICNECGRSVKFGTGLYVNRVMDFNEFEERIEMLKSFPEGEFICSECEEILKEKTNAGNQRIPN